MLAPILAWLRARPPSYSAVASQVVGLVVLTSAADAAGLGGIAGFTVVYTAVADKNGSATSGENEHDV